MSSRNRCKEWRRFWAYFGGHHFNVRQLQEVSGDLFNLDNTFSFAHCVSSDFKMSRGIALEFRHRYGRVRELRHQNKMPGEMAYLKDGRRFIYYLVTKYRYFQKPSYRNIWLALWCMKQHIIANDVRRLGIPKLGCGRDGKDWWLVKQMIEFIFRNVTCDILVVY